MPDPETTPEFESCPYCGSTKVIPIAQHGLRYGYCTICGSQGLVEGNQKVQLKNSWNRVSRAVHEKSRA